MKKLFLIVIVVCGSLTMNAQKTIKIDTSKSIVKWTGSKLFSFSKHYGTVKFISGNIIKSKDVILGGSFEVDMNSIINTDGKYNEMLVGHLKNEDFFDVTKHPTAKLEMISVRDKRVNVVEVKANLTIKGITHEVNFEATVEDVDWVITLTSKFIIDRTLWGIDYESKGVFGSVKDGIISDAIEFEVIVVTEVK